MNQSKERNREYKREWYAKNKHKVAERMRENARRAALQKNYGLSVEEYDRLLAVQADVCAMCGNVCSSGKRLAVDHDHETGEVRGLLCFRCNTELGIYEKRKTAAERYLTRRT